MAFSSEVLAFMDVPNLVQMKSVCHQWHRVSTHAIYHKCGDQRKAFQSHEDLRHSVAKFIRNMENRDDAEVIVRTHGYPIGKWDVPNVVIVFSRLFQIYQTLNLDFGEWSTSGATRMAYRICSLKQYPSTNQPLVGIPQRSKARIEYSMRPPITTSILQIGILDSFNHSKPFFMMS